MASSRGGCSCCRDEASEWSVDPEVLDPGVLGPEVMGPRDPEVVTPLDPEVMGPTDPAVVGSCCSSRLCDGRGGGGEASSGIQGRLAWGHKQGSTIVSTRASFLNLYLY